MGTISAGLARIAGSRFIFAQANRRKNLYHPATSATSFLSAMPPLQLIRSHARRTFESVSSLTQREKQHLIGELQQTRGLMPILMKQRNGQRWSVDDRRQLRSHFGRLSRLSPYLVLVVMPGGFLMLPAFAWWLDRRRRHQRPLQPPAG